MTVIGGKGDQAASHGRLVWSNSIHDVLNVDFAAATLNWGIVTVDQYRVLTGGSLREAENFSLSRFHEAVIQLVASHSHC